MNLKFPVIPEITPQVNHVVLVNHCPGHYLIDEIKGKTGVVIGEHLQLISGSTSSHYLHNCIIKMDDTNQIVVVYSKGLSVIGTASP